MIKKFFKIFIVAAFSSLIAGLLLTLIQQSQVLPLIQEAESYEQAVRLQMSVLESKSHRSSMTHTHEHQDDKEAWQPEDGLQRNFFTASANVVFALGFALLLGATVTLRAKKINWRSGLLWGLAGYAIFVVAPSLGLPPEVPGTQVAELANRQIWWVFTAFCTASGLAFIIFNHRLAIKIFGILLLIAPHVIGAPQPEFHSSTAPAELAQAFVFATLITNGIFWLSLGGLYGFFHQKIAN